MRSGISRMEGARSRTIVQPVPNTRVSPANVRLVVTSVPVFKARYGAYGAMAQPIGIVKPKAKLGSY